MPWVPDLGYRRAMDWAQTLNAVGLLLLLVGVLLLIGSLARKYVSAWGIGLVVLGLLLELLATFIDA